MLFSRNVYCENDLIKAYIELSVELEEDTVSMNNDLVLTVVFTNKTDRCIEFYPKGLLSVIRPSGGFEFDSYFLNKALDLRVVGKIEPRGEYKETYNVKVEPPVFREGINYLHLYYICKELKGKLKMYKKLHGSLESEEFQLFVR